MGARSELPVSGTDGAQDHLVGQIRGGETTIKLRI
jgi:hypothetical protein